MSWRPPRNGPLGPIVPTGTELAAHRSNGRTTDLHWEWDGVTKHGTSALCGTSLVLWEVTDHDKLHAPTCTLCEQIAQVLQAHHENTSPPPQVVLRWSDDTDPDDRFLEAVVCPHCQTDNSIVDIEAAPEQHNQIEFRRDNDGAIVATIIEGGESDFETVRYGCTECRRSVSLPDGVEVTYP